MNQTIEVLLSEGESREGVTYIPMTSRVFSPKLSRQCSTNKLGSATRPRSQTDLIIRTKHFGGTLSATNSFLKHT